MLEPACIGLRIARTRQVMTGKARPVTASIGAEPPRTARARRADARYQEAEAAYRESLALVRRAPGEWTCGPRSPHPAIYV